MDKSILTNKEFNCNTIEDFYQMAENNDFRIAKAVVETILNNLNTKKRFVNVMSINILNTGEVIDLTADRKEFISILKKNIVHYEKQELYEDCIKIQNAIEYLISKQS